MAKSLFNILQKLSDEDKDIRRSDTFVSIQSCKQGGHLTMGIDHKTTQELVLTPEKFLVVAFVISREQYKEIENA